MGLFSRRDLLKNLPSLPAFGWVAPQGVLDLQPESKLTAVNALRFLNTVQLWHLRDTGSYASLDELQKSSTFERFRTNTKAIRTGLADYCDFLELDKREAIRGWNLEFTCSEDGAEYSARLVRNSPDHKVAFSTNHEGLIYEGQPLNQKPMTAALLPRESIASAAPLPWKLAI